MLIGLCTHCSGRLFITCFGGSALSGANFYLGYCYVCVRQVTVRNSRHFLIRILWYVNRRKAMRMKYIQAQMQATVTLNEVIAYLEVL